MSSPARIKALYPAPGWRAFQCIHQDDEFVWMEIAVIGWVVEKLSRDEGDQLILYGAHRDGGVSVARPLSEIADLAENSNWAVIEIGPTEELTNELKLEIQKELSERGDGSQAEGAHKPKPKRERYIS